jgi:hypothetical protein
VDVAMCFAQWNKTRPRLSDPAGRRTDRAG